VKQGVLALEQAIRDRISVDSDPPILQELLSDEDDDYLVHETFEPEAVQQDIDIVTPEALDNLISAEVLLPKGDVLISARVIGCKRDPEGNLIGTQHSNPILDTRIYDVQFPDGHVESYAANIIAENIFAQVDEDGRRFLLLDEIMDHRKDNTSVHIDDKFIQRGSNQTLRKTTQGWYFQVRWRDGTASWEPLKDLRVFNPVEIAEYVVANKLSEEPAFAWWVPHTLKKRDHIVAQIKRRVMKRNNKFGLEVPTTVKQALKIDCEKGTDYWQKAIEKEMTHVMCAFNILEEGAEEPRMSKRIPCHLFFDVKMDFTWKVHFVAGGHITDPPASITFASVVSQDSVRLAFLIAVLNDLDI
jgi:hypothetical protein